MRRGTLVVGLISAVATVGLVTTSAAAASVKPTGSGIPTNVDASQWHHNESEGTIAVNPTNPNNIVIITNVDFPAAGMFKGVSFDGGKTWRRTLIGNGDNLGDACCDPTMSFDSSGTLFMAYLLNVGPTGAVMNVCTLGESGQGGGKLFVNVDPDGLGPQPFGSSRTSVVDTHVGGFDFIAPQPDRSIDAEPGLAWDRSGGPHNGRVYLVYTFEAQNESDNPDIFVRYSDNQGLTWRAPVRVNDDATTNSHVLPKISLDQTTGSLALVWSHSRN